MQVTYIGILSKKLWKINILIEKLGKPGAYQAEVVAETF